MTSGPTVEYDVSFTKGWRGRQRLREGREPETPQVAPGRVPRVARLMALAIRFDGLVGDGHVRSYSQLAELGHVTRARLTQIMNLRFLAPDIQEAILFLPRVACGRDPITERHLRPIAAEPDWDKQRELWRRLPPHVAAYASRRTPAR
jgi:hypothetical protein